MRSGPENTLFSGPFSLEKPLIHFDEFCPNLMRKKWLTAAEMPFFG